MDQRDPPGPTDDEARIQRLRLEAMRDEMARRPLVHSERDWTREKRAAGASFKGGTLLLFIVLILGGLYVLKLSSKALGFDGSADRPAAR
jgi:hypothetical protein